MKTGLNKKSIRKHRKELRARARRRARMADKRAMTRKLRENETLTVAATFDFLRPSGGKVFRKGVS